jgi:hypothetical protein
MRKLAILLVAASSLWAQRPVTSPSGYGRILFPGGGGPSATGGAGFGRVLSPGMPNPPSVAAPVNSNVGMTFVGGPPPINESNRRGGRSQGVIGVPMFVGGYNAFDPNWNWGYGTPYSQPAQFVVPAEPRPDSPVVIVNQYFNSDASGTRPVPQLPNAPEPSGVPQPSSAGNASLAGDRDRDTIFMIAMKDHSIYAASAYWVEDGTLNYITIQGDPNSVSMDLVDRDLSQRLNRDRRIPFGLPSR